MRAPVSIMGTGRAVRRQYCHSEHHLGSRAGSWRAPRVSCRTQTLGAGRPRSCTVVHASRVASRESRVATRGSRLHGGSRPYACTTRSCTACRTTIDPGSVKGERLSKVVDAGACTISNVALDSFRLLVINVTTLEFASQSNKRSPVSRAKKIRHCYCLLRVSYGVM